MNSINLSPKEAAEADNIVKFKKNLYKLSEQLVHVQIVKEEGRDVLPNIPDEANGPQKVHIAKLTEYLTK